MLTRRMEAALVYLKNNPEAICIASGGQGPGEAISEAECMRRFLVAGGIEESRIYLEDRSTSTYENLHFSAAIIAAHDLPREVAIATDIYHQCRAQGLAYSERLLGFAVVSRTTYSLLPFYWLREIAAIWASWGSMWAETAW